MERQIKDTQLELLPTNSMAQKIRQEVRKRANDLDGKTWTRFSISVWGDIKKTKEEMDLRHPALFPIELAMRLIQCFTTPEDKRVLDPFVGVGSAVLAAQALGKTGIGIEISKKFADIASNRPVTRELIRSGVIGSLGQRFIYNDDARNLPGYVDADSVDFVVTSPPYWDILTRKRTADYKATRHYGEELLDLGKIKDYKEFLSELKKIFQLVFVALKPGKYCCVVVMDIRKQDVFFPFHVDVAKFMCEVGFIWDDVVIWDRRHEYNNMRPLGYPAKFRINKAHEFILIFQKPS